MNAVMERWVLTCSELLDRTLIWNQRHLMHALRMFEQFYNRHRHRRTRALPTPGRCAHYPPPIPLTDVDAPASAYRGMTASAASSMSTDTPLNLRRWEPLLAGS